MSKVTAKFRVIAVADTGYDSGKSVTLAAVYSADPAHENHSWSKYTPDGRIAMTITNEAALEKFVAGAEYLVEFTKVESDPSDGS